ncbi:hypothetical protein [Nonomuraea sp. NPDC050310]|uniref:hypothetical protein n=1 Tax=Nonomuraea sp. NPDC050310 TaxID=3154935 RepID=UPI0033D4E4CD
MSNSLSSRSSALPDYMGKAATSAMICLLVIASAASATAPSPSPPEQTATAQPSAARVSACRGRTQSPNLATVSGRKYIEIHSWTQCWGDVVSITAYLQLEKRNGPHTWAPVAGPLQGHFTGIGVKHYLNGAALCGAPGIGRDGNFRAKGWATWEDTEGRTGATDTAYSGGVTLTC